MNNEKYYKIYIILVNLGFKNWLIGTKLLIKAILKADKLDGYYNLNDIYSAISKESKRFSPLNVKTRISYAIDNRNKEKTEKNFQKIFGYDYNIDFFTTKKIIDEIVRVINR